MQQKNLSPVQLPTMTKDTDGQLKLAPKVVDVVEQANRKICVTPLRCNGEKPESSYASSIIRTEEGGREFSTNCLCKYELEELIYLLDIMNSVYDKVFTN